MVNWVGIQIGGEKCRFFYILSSGDEVELYTAKYTGRVTQSLAPAFSTWGNCEV